MGAHSDFSLLARRNTETEKERQFDAVVPFLVECN